jgi:hypothetical protein
MAAPVSPSGKNGVSLKSVAVPTSWKLAPNQGGWKAYTHLAYDAADYGFNEEDGKSDGALDLYFTGGYETSWEAHTARAIRPSIRVPAISVSIRRTAPTALPEEHGMFLTPADRPVRLHDHEISGH